jgi:hypothetical protein
VLLITAHCSFLIAHSFTAYYCFVHVVLVVFGLVNVTAVASGFVSALYKFCNAVLLAALINAFVPKLAVMLFPCANVTLARLLQLLKTLFPILVTRAGMVMLVRLLQLSKAEFPIKVTPAGMVMLARLRQYIKALT